MMGTLAIFCQVDTAVKRLQFPVLPSTPDTTPFLGPEIYCVALHTLRVPIILNLSSNKNFCHYNITTILYLFPPAHSVTHHYEQLNFMFVCLCWLVGIIYIPTIILVLSTFSDKTAIRQSCPNEVMQLKKKANKIMQFLSESYAKFQVLTVSTMYEHQTESNGVSGGGFFICTPAIILATKAQ